MNSVILYAIFLTLVYSILRTAMLKLGSQKKSKEMPNILNESVLVFVSVFACQFLFKRVGWAGIGDGCGATKAVPSVFTDGAGF